MAQVYVWYCLVDDKGLPYANTTVTSIEMEGTKHIDHFRKAIKAVPDNPLKGIAAAQLRLHENKEAFDRKQLLKLSKFVGELKTTEDDCLYVVVPSEGNSMTHSK